MLELRCGAVVTDRTWFPYGSKPQAQFLQCLAMDMLIKRSPLETAFRMCGLFRNVEGREFLNSLD